MVEKLSMNAKMLALLVYEYLRSSIALLNAPDYTHTNHTQNVLYYLAKPLGLKAKTEHNNFDLAFLDDVGSVVLFMEDEDNSLNFRKEELPKLVGAKVRLRVGVTYDSKLEEREKIVQNAREALKQKKTEGLFLLILGYVQDTKREEPYIRFDGFLFDDDGKLMWKNQDIQNIRTNLRTE